MKLFFWLNKVYIRNSIKIREMDDEELQAIRAQRMAQLQNQYGVCVYIWRARCRSDVKTWRASVKISGPH